MTTNIETRLNDATGIIEVQASRITDYADELESRGEEAITGAGGVFIGDYAADITFNERNEYVIYQGQSYKVKSSTPLPFISTGNFSADLQSLQPYDNGKEAKGFADKAKVEADKSESASVKAEQAVVEASLNAGVYETVKDGVDNTQSGQLFNVKSQFTTGFVDLYKNDSGVGVYQNKTSPDRAFVERTSMDALTNGFKKYKNLIKGDALVSSQCVSIAALDLIAISKASAIDKGLLPDNVNTYHKLASGSLRVMHQDEQSGMTAKYVVCGHFTYSPTIPTGNISAVFNGAYFVADEYGYVKVADDLYLRWYKVNNVEAGKDAGRFGTKLYQRDVNDYDFGAFVAVSSDKDMSYLDVDIFNLRDDKTTLLDEEAAETIGDFLLAPPQDTIPFTSTDPSVTSIVQNGTTFALTDPAKMAGYMVKDFDFNPYNKYVMFSVFVYYQDRARCRDLKLIFRDNETAVFPDLNMAEAVYTKTEVAPNVDRWDVSFKFYENYTEGAGFGVSIGTYANVGDFDVFFFGPTLAVSDSQFGYLSSIAPATFLPFWNVVKGATLFNPNRTSEVQSPFLGKKAVWLGTSIPNGCNYPAASAAKLGMTLTDLTIGGGHLTAFQYDGSFPASSAVIYNFTVLKSEVQAEYGPNLGQEVDPDDYATLQPGSGFVLEQAHIDALTAHNVEAVLDPIMADTDVVMVDYGINDRVTGAPEYPDKWPQAKDAGDDRSNFAGAFSWLYKRCFAVNPNVQFFILTHHNRSIQEKTINVVDSQLDVAEFWGVPVLNFAQTSNLNDVNLLEYTDGWKLHPPRGGDIDKKYERQITNWMKGL